MFRLVKYCSEDDNGEDCKDENETNAPTFSPNAEKIPLFPQVSPGPTPFLPNTSIIPIVITGITLEDVSIHHTTGEITATGGVVNGTIGDIPFTTTLSNFVLTFPGGPTTLLVANNGSTCAILTLTVGPINVELLGLHIDTSSICCYTRCWSTC